MSLVVLLVIEIVGWVAFNRFIPCSVSRGLIAMATATAFAALMTVYAAVFQPLLINPENMLLFALMNTVLALIIGLVALTRAESSVT